MIKKNVNKYDQGGMRVIINNLIGSGETGETTAENSNSPHVTSNLALSFIISISPHVFAYVRMKCSPTTNADSTI